MGSVLSKDPLRECRRQHWVWGPGGKGGEDGWAVEL